MLFICASLCASLCACASSGAAGQEGPGSPGEVTYTNAARGSSLSLVSESMLIEMGIPGDTAEQRILNFNSEKRSSAAVKVCSDDILEGVVQLFESEGFERYAIDGTADVADSSLDGVLQVTFKGEARYMLNSDSTETDPEAKITFAKLLNMFAQIYGEVRQYQAVEGQIEFKKPEVSTKLRNEARANELLPGSIR